jgi:hypothetical protein
MTPSSFFPGMRASGKPPTCAALNAAAKRGTITIELPRAPLTAPRDRRYARDFERATTRSQ